MIADLATMLTWTVFLLIGVGVSSHLHRQMGVLLASQGLVMTLAALVDCQLLRQGFSTTVALMTGVTAGGLLGLFHVPVLYQTGAALLLVLTALSQIVLVELWYAFPQVTGGSGGVLLPPGASGAGVLWALLVLVVCGVAYLGLFVAKAERRFDWACLRSLGLQAGAMGVRAGVLFGAGFLLYGTLLGAAGITATRLLGYLTVTSFGLPWALAVVMIVLASEERPVLWSVVLSLLYSSMQVLLRQSVYASPTWSNMFEMMFPICLLILSEVRSSRAAAKAACVSAKEALP